MRIHVIREGVAIIHIDVETGLLSFSALAGLCGSHQLCERLDGAPLPVQFSGHKSGWGVSSTESNLLWEGHCEVKMQLCCSGRTAGRPEEVFSKSVLIFLASSSCSLHCGTRFSRVLSQTLNLSLSVSGHLQFHASLWSSGLESKMATFNYKKRWQVQKLLLCILLVGSSTDFKMLNHDLALFSWKAKAEHNQCQKPLPVSHQCRQD